MIVKGFTVKGSCKLKDSVEKVADVDVEFGINDKGREFMMLSVKGFADIQVPFEKIDGLISNVRANKWVG